MRSTIRLSNPPKRRLLVSVLTLFCFAASNGAVAFASGFAVYTHGAGELGMQNNTVAHTSGAASAYSNPALITRLDGTRLETGSVVIFPEIEFKSAVTGKTVRGESHEYTPATLFFTRRFTPSISMGLALFSPFGLGTDWGKKWEGRYITTRSEMKTLNLNPSLAWRVNERLSVALGACMLFAEANLKRNLNLAAFGLPDGEQVFSGEGAAPGYNLGVFLRVSENWTAGAHYRSAFRVNFEGDAEFKLPETAPVILKTMLPDTPGESRIELPALFSLGLCYRGFEGTLFEFGVRWEQWSLHEAMVLEFESPVSGNRFSVSPREWEDVWSFGAGMRHELNVNADLLLGYRYDGNPVPDETFEPALLGSDKHIFSLGVDCERGQWRGSFTFAYESFRKRTKNNTVGEEYGSPADGRYLTRGYLAGVSLGRSF
jgi:long-chain fatty acid transport protein